MAPEKDWLAEALADWIESIIAGKIITGADNLRSLLAAMAVWTRGCVRSRDAPSLSSPLLTLTFARVLTPLRPRRRNHLSKPRHHVFALSPRKLVPCHERALRWIESPAAPVPPPVLVHRPLLHDTTRPRDHDTTAMPLPPPLPPPPRPPPLPPSTANAYHSKRRQPAPPLSIISLSPRSFPPRPPSALSSQAMYHATIYF